MSAIYNKRNFLRVLSIALAMALVLSVTGVATAAGRTSLNKKKLTLKTGKTAVLKLKNNNKKTSWKVVSGKKRISITVLSQNSIKVRGISKGKAVVQVKAGKKKYRCKVTVKGSNNGTSSGDSSSSTPKTPSTPSPSPSPLPETPVEYSVSGLIGQSADSLQQRFGAPVRIDSGAQDFDSYIYNPNGNYSAYMIVGVKDNVVVYCFTISKGFSYGSYVKAGDGVNTLESNGWVADDFGCGMHNQYRLDLDGETAFTYYDRLGNRLVYGILIFSTNYFSPYAFFYDGSNDYDAEKLAGITTEIKELTNAYRVYNGLSVLKENSNGDTAIRLHCEDMAKNKYIDHFSLDGRTFGDRLLAAGVSFTIVGENLAHGAADAPHLVNAWINSPGHRVNIVNSSYEYIGTGAGYRNSTVFDPDWTVNGNLYAGQIFWK